MNRKLEEKSRAKCYQGNGSNYFQMKAAPWKAAFPTSQFTATVHEREWNREEGIRGFLSEKNFVVSGSRAVDVDVKSGNHGIPL